MSNSDLISPQFYTTLVLAAVLTSQLAGAWLDYVLRRGLPLLLPEARPTAEGEARDEPLAGDRRHASGPPGPRLGNGTRYCPPLSGGSRLRGARTSRPILQTLLLPSLWKSFPVSG